MQKIKKGDMVQVISGNHLDIRGEVESVIRPYLMNRSNQRVGRDQSRHRVIVKGVNIRKKHQRQTGQTRTQTGIIEREEPIHVSNVMLVCPSCDEAVRVGFRVEDNRKVRYCKRCEAKVD